MASTVSKLTVGISGPALQLVNDGVGTARRGEFVAASTSGETLPLTEGTYTFGTILMPQAYNPSQTSIASGDTVVTKVMVRDASAPEPTGVSIP